MAGYGATYAPSSSNYDEYKDAPHWPGGLKGEAPVFVRDRRRMNLVSMIWSVILPWALFAAVLYAMSSELRFQQPAVAFSIVVLCALATVGLLAAAFDSQRKKRDGGSQLGPNWLMFLFLTALVGFVLALIGGELSYRFYLLPYLNVQNLATYAMVNTALTRGEQVMDSGLITFAANTNLNIPLSMGYKSDSVYCVAPISTGSANLTSYDFWAVGKDCCAGGAANFHCHKYSGTPEGLGRAGALRLFRDEERPYYRLAVQQAEATHGIKSSFPIFFTWERDPLDRKSVV